MVVGRQGQNEPKPTVPIESSALKVYALSAGVYALSGLGFPPDAYSRTSTLMATGFHTSGVSLTSSVTLPVSAGNVQKVPGT